MTVIKISALWCPACILTGNALKKLNEVYDFELKELDYDFDDIEEYHIGDVLPVVIFIKDGKEVDRLNGEKNYKQLEEVLEKYE